VLALLNGPLEDSAQCQADWMERVKGLRLPPYLGPPLLNTTSDQAYAQPANGVTRLPACDDPVDMI